MKTSSQCDEELLFDSSKSFHTAKHFRCHKFTVVQLLLRLLNADGQNPEKRNRMASNWIHQEKETGLSTDGISSKTSF